MQPTTIPGDDTRPSPRRAAADPHGQAALFLSESILHALIEDKTLTRARAIGVVQTALEVTADIAEEANESQGRALQSMDLLSAIERTLKAGGNSAGERANVTFLRP